MAEGAMPEIVWVPLIVVAVWGGAVWFCLGTGTVPFNIGNIYRENNPLPFWIFVGFFALAAGTGLVLTLYGVWITYIAPLLH